MQHKKSCTTTHLTDVLPWETPVYDARACLSRRRSGNHMLLIDLLRLSVLIASWLFSRSAILFQHRVGHFLLDVAGPVSYAP